MAIVACSRLLGAAVLARFANRCEIKNLKRVVLLLLGVVAILLKAL